MKGFNKGGCYRFGGTLKTKSVHGVKTGNHNNANVVRSATKYRGSGGRAQANDEDVEGPPPRARMDRPDRSRISEDSRREIARLEGKRNANQVGSGSLLGTGLGLLGTLGRSRVGRAVGLGTTGAGAAWSAKTIPENADDREIKRLKDGRVKNEYEDRKSGGRVKREVGGVTKKPTHAPDSGHKYRAPYGDPGRISDDSEQAAKKIDKNMPLSVGNANGLMTGAGIGSALHFLKNSRMPIPVRGLAAAGSMALATKGAKNLVDDYGDASRGIGERIDLRDGKVKDEYEDRKSGGRVNRANGGAIKKETGGGVSKDRLSEDSKKEARRLRDEVPSGFSNPNAVGTGIALGATLAKGMPKPIRKAAGVITGMGLYNLGKDASRRYPNIVEADRIEKGLVTPEKEDR